MKHLLKVTLFCFPLLVYAAGSDNHSHDHDKDEHGLSYGQAGSADHADKTIQIIMTDNKFDLASLEVESGQTIRFKIANEGRQIHEFSIDTSDKHARHQDEMLNHINAGHMTMTDKGNNTGHDHPNSLLLNPGETGELTWMFADADNLEFACNVPGHYQSGMVGQIHFR